MAENQFSVKVPNVLEALMAGEQGYKEVKGYQSQNALDEAGQYLKVGDYNAASDALFRAGKLDAALGLLKMHRENAATQGFGESLQSAFGGGGAPMPQTSAPAVTAPNNTAPPASAGPLARLMTPRPSETVPVPSSSRVVGDAEGVSAGLYDPPATPGGRPPVQIAQAGPTGAIPTPQPPPAVPQAQPNMGGPGTVNPQHIPGLIRALGDPNLPQGQRQVGLEILKTALQGAQMPNDLKEYTFAKASGDPKAQVPYTDWLRGNKQAGALAITNDMRGENEESKAFGKSAGERGGAMMAAAGAAPKKLQNLSRMEGLLSQVEQGKIQPARMSISAWAKSLGLDDAAAERLGLDPKGVGTAQAIGALSNELALGHIGPGGIPANNFSNTDRTFVTDIVPKLANDPAGNKIMIESARRLEQLNIEKAREWQAFRRNPANKGKGFDDFESDWNQTVSKRDLFGDLTKRAEAIVGPQRQAPRGMPQGARRANDGNWYVDDPQRPGKYLQVR